MSSLERRGLGQRKNSRSNEGGGLGTRVCGSRVGSWLHALYRTIEIRAGSPVRGAFGRFSATRPVLQLGPASCGLRRKVSGSGHFGPSRTVGEGRPAQNAALVVGLPSARPRQNHFRQVEKIGLRLAKVSGSGHFSPLPPRTATKAFINRPGVASVTPDEERTSFRCIPGCSLPARPSASLS